jgi:hypothetical protein
MTTHIQESTSPREKQEVPENSGTTKLADLFAQVAAESRKKSSSNLSITHHEEDKFHDAPSHMLNHTSRAGSAASEEDFDDDEFQDA